MPTKNDQFSCPVCRNSALRELVSISDAPVHCNLLWTDRDKARNAPKGDIELVYCPQCGHVANRAFNPALTEYTQAYENSLHFSPRFQSYADSLADDLVARHDLHAKQLVEIGAGQGDFLQLLCALGDNQGLGFDEAYAPEEGEPTGTAVTMIAEFDWQNHLTQTPDMIYARHVLEHIEHPADFVAGIRSAIGESGDTLVFLEVPNMSYTLRELAIWDIIYEHCGYFTPQSLSCLLTLGGFDVLQTKEVFGGQFLTIEALPAADSAPEAGANTADLAETGRRVDAFAAEFSNKVAYWKQQLADWQEQGKRVVAWGAGSKGVTFLNVLQANDQVPYIVDINPRKLGKFVVGTGQEIVSPDFLSDYRPDVVILMNPLYEEEIGQMLANRGVTAELVIA